MKIFNLIDTLPLSIFAYNLIITIMVENINKELFQAKVWNYEKSPKIWEFQGRRPTIVDFYAKWCGPCKALIPILEELSDDYAGKINFYKIDIDQQGDLAEFFNLRSVPTLLFCPVRGKPKFMQGVQAKSELKRVIRETFDNI